MISGEFWVTGQAFPITDGTSFSLVPSWLHSRRMILLELVRNDPPLWAGTSVVEQVLGLSLQAIKSIPSNKGGSTHKNSLETMTFALPQPAG